MNILKHFPGAVNESWQRTNDESERERIKEQFKRVFSITSTFPHKLIS